MPKYEFECPVCQIRFKRSLPMGEHPTHLCPACHEDAPQILTGFSGHAFSEGDKPAGLSGVHDWDYPTADKAVGRSAEKGWADYHERDKVKQKVREQTGSPALARETGNGYIDYSAIGNAELTARKKMYKDAKTILGESKE